MNKLFVLFFLTAVAVAVGQPARAEYTNANAVVVTPDYLSQLADEMRTNHPALRAAGAMTNAAAAAVAAVRTWEDPMVMAGTMAAREDLRASDGDINYGVQQKLPLFGKSRLERNVARVALAKAAFRAVLADRVVAIGEQDLAWLDTMKQLLESNARVGQASQVEILQIQNARAKLSAAQFELADEQLAVREDLHQLTVKVDPARREALLYRDQIIPHTKSVRRSERGADHRLRRLTAPSTEMFHVSTCLANQRHDHHRGTRPRAGALGGGSASGSLRSPKFLSLRT